MLSAGLDIGSLYTKAVVLDDGALAGWSVVPTGESGASAANRALEQALAPRRASPPDVASVVSTGAGKGQLDLAATQATEILCAVAGVNRLHPGVAGLIDLGGESTRAIRLDDTGAVQEFAMNDKCASGTGIFLDAMGEVMGLAVHELGPLSLRSTAHVSVNTTCVVFAESEVVSLVHRQTPKEDILRGIHEAIAKRVVAQANRIDLQGDVLIIGGLAQNVGIVASLKEQLGPQTTVPEQPAIVSALGAAHRAWQQGGAA